MYTIRNILWLFFGGLIFATTYLVESFAFAITIIGIPIAWQIFKIGLLCLWPFGAEIKNTTSPPRYIRIPLNIIWIICGGLQVWMAHILLGIILFVTIIGIPFGKQHFKIARLSLTPFGKDVELH